MTTASCTHRDEVGAVALGLGLLCAVAVALIGGSGVVFWIAGLH